MCLVRVLEIGYKQLIKHSCVVTMAAIMAVVRYMIHFQEFYEALNNNLCAVLGK